MSEQIKITKGIKMAAEIEHRAQENIEIVQKYFNRQIKDECIDQVVAWEKADGIFSTTIFSTKDLKEGIFDRFKWGAEEKQKVELISSGGHEKINFNVAISSFQSSTVGRKLMKDGILADICTPELA